MVPKSTSPDSCKHVSHDDMSATNFFYESIDRQIPPETSETSKTSKTFETSETSKTSKTLETSDTSKKSKTLTVNYPAPT